MKQITEQEIAIEMSKPVIAAVTLLEWMLIMGFIDHIFKDDELVTKAFSTKEDFEAVSKICKELRRQVFPEEKDAIGRLQEKLQIKPKKIITKPSLIV
jgi:hypothetical protein